MLKYAPPKISNQRTYLNEAVMSILIINSLENRANTNLENINKKMVSNNSQPLNEDFI